ncbi:MAG: Casein kinase II subunit alpha [Geoglossum umbratile]|nr:MAG: Casein kinase II subunit alpha [Geoglossum umbratile]
MARVYADVNQRMPRSYWDYGSSKIPWGVLEHYEVVRKIGASEGSHQIGSSSGSYHFVLTKRFSAIVIGRGKRAEVFEGVHVTSRQICAIKVLKPVAMKKVKREIKVLQNLSGGPNIVTLLDVVRDSQSRTPSLIFEYVDYTDFRALYPKFIDYDVRYYLFELLKALDFCHSKGIMHRNVRPHNVLIDHEKRKLRLIGWGTADFYHQGTQYERETYWCSGPELLLDFRECDYSIDMWSLGALSASMIFRKEPFFHGAGQVEQLTKIAKILGTDDLFSYLNKYNIELDVEYHRSLGRFPKMDWHGLVNPENQRFSSNDALDFLDKLLRYDHNERLTAKEAMAHPYVASIRNAATA